MLGEPVRTRRTLVKQKYSRYCHQSREEKRGGRVATNTLPSLLVLRMGELFTLHLGLAEIAKLLCMKTSVERTSSDSEKALGWQGHIVVAAYAYMINKPSKARNPNCF